MAVEKIVAKETKNNAIDLLITLVVDELAIDLQIDPDEMFAKFVASKTGEILYDEESKLWWSGPSDIAELYKKETMLQEVNQQ